MVRDVKQHLHLLRLELPRGDPVLHLVRQNLRSPARAQSPRREDSG